MRHLRRTLAVAALFTTGLCGWASAQHVLEQAPSDAVGVFEVKDLQGLSTKVAKFAKTLGVDQFDPRWADPLATMMDEMDVKQGLNKNGDMAIAFFNPENHKGQGANNEGAAPKGSPPPAVALIPVEDYKAFLGNFADVKDGGDGISEVTVKKNQEKLFVIERGKYAAAAMDKSLLTNHDGIKLQGPAAKEAEAKDAILYFDIKTMRPQIQKGLKEARAEMARQMNNAAPGQPFAGMPASMKKMMDQYLNAADEIVNDSRSATLAFNLSDTGISTSGVADFEPDSYLGKMAAQVQNTNEPLLAGLPPATYFAFGGARLTPEVISKLIGDFMAPMKKDLAAGANGQEMTKAFDAMQKGLSSMKSFTMGYVASGAGPGQGLISTVAVAHGDAHKILDSQKAALPAAGAFMDMSGGGKSSAKILTGDPKSVDGVELQTYTIKFEFDHNDPQAMQAQQGISMIFGRNGLTGAMGAVNDNTFVQVQGGTDKLLADAIAAAKNNSDTLDQSKQVRQVTAELPKQRAMEYYVAVDNIATEVVKFAKQQGMALPFHLPPNLPPIGVSAGTEGTTVRFDAVIPTQLIQSITAATMQAMMQMNGGPGAGQGGGI